MLKKYTKRGFGRIEEVAKWPTWERNSMKVGDFK